MATPRTKVLFLTNSEYGQSNVVLATAYELVNRENVEVHLASHNPIKARVDQLNAGEFGALPPGQKINFHLISLESMHEARMTKFNVPNIEHAPNVKDALRTYKVLAQLAGTRTGEEYIKLYKECLEIIQSVDPDAIVIEEIFVAPAVDACRTLKKKYTIITPVTFHEHLSGLSSLWNYPAKGSGKQWPVRKREIPSNLYLNVRLIHKFVTAKSVKPIHQARKDAGLEGRHPSWEKNNPDVTYLFPSTPETDFPIDIPPNFISCGPIYLTNPPLAQSDPELEAWLKQRPTVLLCLGSFYKTTPEYTTELAKAAKILLDGNSTVQVLWKLRHEGELQADVKEILTEHLASGRVKIEKWLKVQPSAVLLSGHVICYVHHGGANSYFEAVSAGVPQIILPVWYDTYEFAHRVEYLGIGIYGSKKSKTAPKADAKELGEAMLKITDAKSGETIKLKAQELAKVANGYGGRKKAADKILEIAQKTEKETNGVKGVNEK